MRALALLAMVGCLEGGEPAPYVPATCSANGYYEPPASPRLDLLFVIDDSAAMAPYTSALEANAPVFMNVLSSSPTSIDMRIAVARGSDGTLVDPVPCGAQPGSHFLEDSHHDLTRNFTGTLQDVFTCLTRVGTAATRQQVLVAATTALRNNRDFLRDNAYLMVVIIAAEDDGSPSETQTYAYELDASKPTVNHVLPSVITHLPSTRLKSFVDGYGPLGTIVSIDQASWADAFGILFWPGGQRGRLCIDGVLLEPTTCTFRRVQSIGTPMQREVGTMPLCNPAGQPDGICAALVSDAMCNPSGTRIELCYNGFDPNNPQQYCPSGVTDPVDGEVVVIECAIKCD